MWRAVTKRSLRIHDAQHRPDLQNRPSTHSQFKSRLIYFHRKKIMEKKIDQQTMKQ